MRGFFKGNVQAGWEIIPQNASDAYKEEPRPRSEANQKPLTIKVYLMKIRSQIFRARPHTEKSNP